MRYLTITVIVLSLFLSSGCSTRETSDILGDIARGVVIFNELQGDWITFKELAEDEGLSSETAIAAADTLWNSAIELRPITYKQLKRHPELIELYSTARITLASVLNKPTPPELTEVEIDLFLAGQTQSVE